MDWNPQGTRKMWQAQNYMVQKHTEGPEGDQHDLVRSQKRGSELTEMESNCGSPVSPTGQRGLDDDDFVITLKCAKKLCGTAVLCSLK